LNQIDKVMLQTHLNDLAKRMSEGRVKHSRFYLKAIFEEAIDQDFATKNPARKLALPKQLRAVDKTTLTWDQLRSVVRIAHRRRSSFPMRASAMERRRTASSAPTIIAREY
jgi:hypothetical protein